jgi:hypothetical protein
MANMSPHRQSTGVLQSLIASFVFILKERNPPWELVRGTLNAIVSKSWRTTLRACAFSPNIIVSKPCRITYCMLLTCLQANCFFKCNSYVISKLLPCRFQAIRV